MSNKIEAWLVKLNGVLVSSYNFRKVVNNLAYLGEKKNYFYSGLYLSSVLKTDPELYFYAEIYYLSVLQEEQWRCRI